MQLLITQFPLASYYLVRLRSKYLTLHPILKHPQLSPYVSLSVTDQVSHPVLRTSQSAFENLCWVERERKMDHGIVQVRSIKWLGM